MYLGIDCGTQSTKVVVFDPQTEGITAQSSVKHNIITDSSGRSEQKASWWIDALRRALQNLFKENPEIKPAAIQAMGVSAQHHGLVMLDEKLEVLGNVKLWNDTSTAAENDEIVASSGGMSELFKRIGTTMPVGYTASKVLWTKRNKPELYSKMRHLLLPHDYINFWLTGEICSDYSDASGTGFFNAAKGEWSEETIDIIDDSGILKKALPFISDWRVPIGRIRREIAEEFGFNTDTLVSSGGGDNAMAAIGTGNITQGRATMVLGTSGVINVYTDVFPEHLDPMLQVINLNNDAWLITTCTLNATSSTALLQKFLDIDIAAFNELLQQSAPGAEGISIFPYYGGERMPPLPNAQGVIKGLNYNNFTKSNLIRASAEAVILNLKWGYDLMTRSISKPDGFRITGGGANNMTWIQIAADIIDNKFIRLQSNEGSAFGAALQAMYAVEKEKDLRAICDKYVKIENNTLTTADKNNAEFYRNYYIEYSNELKREFFKQ